MPTHIRAVSPVPGPSPRRYSILTLVTDPVQHAAMVASFEAGGFRGEDCEYLYLDNAGGNRLSAYAGLNRLMSEASGDVLILCHQDVRLIEDGRAELDQRLAELDQCHPAWGVAGNAGGVAPGRLALRISDPHGRNVHVGSLPERVASLDENFLVVRRTARLSFSRDLDGFHFYGTDICLQAEVAGWSAHVIDFHLEHLSPGAKSPEFFACEAALRAKYARAFRPRWIQTTCALLLVTPSPVIGAIAAAFSRPLARLARRLPGSRGWSQPAAA